METFGGFIDTNLPPLLSGANDVISIDHVLLSGIVFHALPRIASEII